MRRTLVRRLLRIPPVVLGVVTLLFLMLELAPGDPARMVIAPGMSESTIAQIRANYGLDQPVTVRYVRWIGNAAQGDLGHSLSMGRPVSRVIVDLLPQTLLLVGLAMGIAFVLGILIGTWQAVRAGGVADGVLNGITLFFHSMPSFWLAIMLVLVFSLLASQWGWPITFPASGTRGISYEFMSGGEQFVDRIRHLVLPVATLALVMLGGISRQVRTAVLEQLNSDHVRAARGRGHSERTILFRHVLRNALLPIITLAGLYLPVLFGGAVFVESVFAWPGMGRALVGAIGARDFPLIIGISFVLSLVVVLGNLIADLLYLRADPRIRYE